MTSLKEFAGLKVALYGDLKRGRTIHSLVYALARLRACIIPMPAKGLELPEHVTHRLQRDYKYAPTIAERRPHGQEPPVDLIYVTPKGPHQQTIYGYLEAPPELRNVLSEIHVFYVTRLQSERMGDAAGAEAYQKIDKEFLKKKSYKDSRVMHPLPRVGELGYDLDDDSRGIYFKQAAYGVSVRMALLTWLLDLKKTGTVAAPRESEFSDYRNSDGIRCGNPSCITKQPSEQQYLVPEFWILEQKDTLLLRCKFCEYEYAAACVGRISKREFYTEPARVKSVPRGDRILFANVQDAINAGYALHPEPTASDCLPQATS
jgi:hypothetical protein